jgi:hypothetical protein
MKNLQKIGLLTLLVLLVAGVRGYFIWKERHAPVVNPHPVEQYQLTSDDVVQRRKLLIDDLKSAKALDGKTVWMQTGFVLEYFPYTAHKVDLAHKVGLLPSVQQLDIQDMVEQKTTDSTRDHLPGGKTHVFAVFKKPDDPKEYAVAVAYVDGSDSHYYCDDMFFYDDPHQLYKHWPANVWQAVDAHQAKAGMNELQVSMALGNQQQSDSSDAGNRTVIYTVNGAQVAVTFANDKATQVKTG